MILTLLALLAVDCNPGTKVIGPLPSERQILATDSRFKQRLDTVGTVEPVSGTPDQVFDALIAVYADLSLPVSDPDKEGHRVGVRGAKCMRQLGKIPLSRFLDCGSGMTGSNADSWRVVLTVISTVRPEPDSKASVSTFVTGEAVDMSGSASDRMGCSSTGNLESEVQRRVKVKLAQH
ncbi:MAG: hypothetical protein ABI647_07915 [Gemmatimonadota bacterium]